jgi:hypothetical protein
MPLEQGSPSPERSPKEVFFNIVKERLEEMKRRGQLPDVYADGVIERAGYIEGPFTGASEAVAKAEEYLRVVEPVADFYSHLNITESHILALSADVNLMVARSSERNELDEAKRQVITQKLEAFNQEISDFADKIKVIRSQIV